MFPKQSQPENLATILQSDQKIAYLAKNFDVRTDRKSVSLMVEAHRDLTAKELDHFIDLNAQYAIAKGADSASTLLARDYRKAVNRSSMKTYGITAANLDDQQLEDITGQVQKQARFANTNTNSRTTERAVCIGNTYFSGSILTQPTSVAVAPSYSPVGFLGKYIHCYPGSPCQSDCDLVFYSYYTGGTPKFIWGSTPRAARVLTWDVGAGNQGNLGTKYGEQNGSPYVLIGIGLARVNYEYVGWWTFRDTDIDVEVGQACAAEMWVGSHN